MATTISIVIKGISICYLKEVEGKPVWRILFPFNECHSVKFGYEREGSKVFVGHLGKAKGKIDITSDMTLGLADATEDFLANVLDLTADTVKIKTHRKIAKKDNWDEKGVVLTIPGVVFDVRKRLSDFPGSQELDIFLSNLDGSAEQKIDDVAHSIIGKIRLSTGKTVSVRTPTDVIFTTAPDVDHTLIFDNDCKEVIKNQDGTFKNDMEMNYELVGEPGHNNRKFVVSARKREPVELFLADDDKASQMAVNSAVPDVFTVEPPDGVGFTGSDPSLIQQGKPCLVVKVSDPLSIQDLP